jgi:hypothetical protein
VWRSLAFQLHCLTLEVSHAALFRHERPPLLARERALATEQSPASDPAERARIAERLDSDSAHRSAASLGPSE